MSFLKSDSLTSKNVKSADIDLEETVKSIYLKILDDCLFGYNDIKVDGNSLSSSILLLLQEFMDYEISLENLFTRGYSKILGISSRVSKFKANIKKTEKALFKLYSQYEEGKIFDLSLMGRMAKYNHDNPESPISREIIIGNCYLFVFGAYDTTRHSTSWACNFLSENMQIQEQIYEDTKGIELSKGNQAEKLGEIQSLDSFVKETMRLGAPFLFSEYRILTKNAKIGGLKLRKGTALQIGLGAAHFQDGVFKQADVFKPERFDKGVPQTWDRMDYIPFSHGTRSCIGKNFAIMNIKIVIVELLKAFKVRSDPNFDKRVGEYPFNRKLRTQLNISSRT